MLTKIPFSLFALTGTLNDTTPAPTSTPFTLTAHPETDLWRKPGIISHSFPCFTTAMKLSEFHHARVTFHAPWKTLYDQGGVSFVFPPKQRDLGVPPRWIKAGIEHVGGVPRVSIVAADQGSWSDWSLAGGPEGMGLNETSVTLEMMREGPSLIIDIIEGTQRSTVREITWAFTDALLERDPTVHVGAYVAKPTKEEDDPEKGIDIVFEELEVWKQ